MFKIFSFVAVAVLTSACSTLTKDSHVPMNLSFSDNSAGNCSLQNKRESYSVAIPGTENIRRSDDSLRYDCKTKDGRPAKGSIASKVGNSMAGNIILGGGIGAVIDATNDYHREYPRQFVIPVVAR
jgi:hypothetical protein